MALAVVFSTVNGQIASENRGGTERDYMPDTLGSVAALLDSTQTKTDTWDYWPYGEVAARTGTSTTPFTFVGTLGYFKDLLDKLVYVRARHYQPNYARWLTVDPLWPKEPTYSYSSARPIDRVDPSGKSIIGVACAIGCGGCLLCLAGFLYACEWCRGDTDCWAKCIVNVWNDLPAWAKLLCGVACSGCIACLVGYVGSKTGKCAALYASYHALCPNLNDIDSGKATCNDGDNCTTLWIKMSSFTSCIAARKAFKYFCVPCWDWDSGHDTALEKHAAAAAACAAIIAIKCSWWR